MSTSAECTVCDGNLLVVDLMVSKVFADASKSDAAENISPGDCAHDLFSSISSVYWLIFERSKRTIWNK